MNDGRPFRLMLEFRVQPARGDGSKVQVQPFAIEQTGTTAVKRRRLKPELQRAVSLESLIYLLPAFAPRKGFLPSASPVGASLVTCTTTCPGCGSKFSG